MSNEQTMIQNTSIYTTNINTNINHMHPFQVQKVSFQALQSPPLQPYGCYQSINTDLNIKKPIDSPIRVKPDVFMFPSTSLSRMDTINESEDKINVEYDGMVHGPPLSLSINSFTYSPSPLSSQSVSMNNNKSGDNEILSRDVEIANANNGLPAEEHPSLQPKYTNETSVDSSIGTTSARSSANSTILANHNNYFSKENLPKIHLTKNNNPLSSKLIYENMDKYQSEHVAQITNVSSLSLNEQFTMIEDDEDDFDDFEGGGEGGRGQDMNVNVINDGDEDEDDEEEIFDDDDGEYDDEYNDGAPLNLMIPPSLEMGSLLTTEQSSSTSSQETPYEIEYDEDGDHPISIPVEFRKLRLSQSNFNENPFEYGMMMLMMMMVYVLCCCCCFFYPKYFFHAHYMLLCTDMS